MLGLRIEEIIKNINDCNTLADIGCDHGKIGAYSLIRKKAKKAIATDISENSLQKAKDLYKKHKLLDRVEFRVGDGLDVIYENEADCVVIAGMGAFEIIKILSNSKIDVQKYILVAHQDVDKLREFLLNKKFSIEKDYLIKEGKHFYSIIVVNKGVASLDYDENEIIFGKDLYNHGNKYFDEYLLVTKKKFEKILSGIKNKDDEKYIEISNLLSIINKVLGDK